MNGKSTVGNVPIIVTEYFQDLSEIFYKTELLPIFSTKQKHI